MSEVAPDALAEMAQQRTAASERIVKSDAVKRLIVAGPGTGKTYTFEQALLQTLADADAVDKGLALTFIRNLVADLSDALSDVADVFTFHGFCKHLMHRHAVAGLREGWDYYPGLSEIVEADLQLLGWKGIKTLEIDGFLHNLDDSSGVVTRVVDLGNYYNAVSHTDLVHRVLTHFNEHSDAIPTYPLIVVDEYQDFSLLETSFLSLLASRSKVLIAGDDDQALYDFKNASSRFIRQLYADDEYENFELPFCSRCPAVIVEAVNDMIAVAKRNGNLQGRLDKSFRCYLPDKQAVSEAHPKIIHAKCSVQTKKAPYAGRYIAEQIAAIPIEDIQESKKKGYPTVLVIGDKPFKGAVYEVVKERFPWAELKSRPSSLMAALDGYRRIAIDPDSSLGWRIITLCFDFKGCNKLVKNVLEAGSELVPALPGDYREHHRKIAQLVFCLREGENLTPAQELELSTAVGMEMAAIKESLAVVDDDKEEPELSEDSSNQKAGDDEPTILFTSLIGSKGLSASHVFILGFNNGFLPQKPKAITDNEVCKLLVALSRTRIKCHLVSCGHYAAGQLEDSAFAPWIQPHLRTLTVDKTYFAA